MFDNIAGATMSAKRVSQTYNVSRSQSREIVARAAGYRDWHHLTKIVGTPNAPVCDMRSIEKGALPEAMSSYARSHGLLGSVDSWDLAQTIVPDAVLPREVSDPLLAIARDELGRHDAPSWLSVDAVATDQQDGRFIVVTVRDRDGIRGAEERIPIGGTVTMVVTEDGLEPMPSTETIESRIRRAVADYALSYQDDVLPAPVLADDVAAGRHDDLYGVDVPSLRRAIARHGSPEAARDALRAVISIPIFSTMLNTEHAEKNADAGIRFSSRAGVSAQATAYAKDGVLRWVIPFDGMTWDRSLHVEDRSLASSIRVGQPIDTLCPHPWLAGASIAAIHDDGQVLRIETDHRCIRLDTAHLPEDQWIDHQPRERPKVDDVDIGPADDAVRSHLRISVDDMLTSCWDGYRHFSVVVEPGGQRIALMCLLGRDEIGIHVMKTYEGAGSFFADNLPAEFLNHLGPVDDEQDSFWRARIRGLSDRSPYSGVML